MKINILVYVTLILLPVSCGLHLINYKENFNVFKSPIAQGKNDELLLNGIYLQQVKLGDITKYREFYQFYLNGHYIRGMILSKKLVYPNELMSTEYIYFVDDGYGVYSISDNELRMDHFGGNSTTAFRWVFNYFANVDEGSFHMYLMKSDLSKIDAIENIDVTFKFYPTDQIIPYQPTSWYLKKKWYVENVHPSRK